MYTLLFASITFADSWDWRHFDLNKLFSNCSSTLWNCFSKLLLFLLKLWKFNVNICRALFNAPWLLASGILNSCYDLVIFFKHGCMCVCVCVDVLCKKKKDFFLTFLCQFCIFWIGMTNFSISLLKSFVHWTNIMTETLQSIHRIFTAFTLSCDYSVVKI